MENKDKLDEFIRHELEKTYSSPDNINMQLVLSCKDKKELNIINLIFFIILLLQSLFIILIGVMFLSDVYLKLIIVGLGILLLNASIFVYALIINKKGVLI